MSACLPPSDSLSLPSFERQRPVAVPSRELSRNFRLGPVGPGARSNNTSRRNRSLGRKAQQVSANGQKQPSRAAAIYRDLLRGGGGAVKFVMEAYIGRDGLELPANPLHFVQVFWL